MAITWKWPHHAQKVMAKQFWVLFWHLAKFGKVQAPPVCSIDFGSLISLDPSRFGSCSSWQCCRTQLVLQICQLHHLLIRLGLWDNRRWSSYVSRPSPCLNGSRARRRVRHLAPFGDIWHPYVISGPARQLRTRAWPPRRHPGRSGRVHFLLPPSLSRQKRGRSGVAVVSSLRRARARSALHCCPPKLAHSSAVTCSPTFTHKLAVKPSGEPTFPTSPKSGRRDLLLRRTQCWAPRSISSSLIRS